jgi:TRAP-type uncharacterized transport system fused permease subunit
MPAFLLPFVFVLDPQGTGLLLKLPQDGSWIGVIEVIVKSAIGMLALAGAAQGFALRRTTSLERWLLLLAGVLLVFPSLIEAIVEPIIRHNLDYAEFFGFAIGLVVIIRQWMTMRRARATVT